MSFYQKGMAGTIGTTTLSTNNGISGNVKHDSDKSSPITREKFKELIKSIEKNGDEWFDDLTKVNNDINEIHRLGIQYPNSNHALGSVAHDLIKRQNEISVKISTLQNLLWNIRHQINTIPS